MRLHCWFCHKSVSNELPEDTTIRAICVCPECVPIVIPEDAEVKPKERQHKWEFSMNGSFCKYCGAAIGSGVPCK